MQHAGFPGREDNESFYLEGKNIIDGFKQKGYSTYGTGAVEWFNTGTETGKVLTNDFDEFYFAGNTWSLEKQLKWIETKLSSHSKQDKIFLFLNIGETHVPYWHEGAAWAREPSPCIPFGGKLCSRKKSKYRQLKCLEWIDTMMGNLIYQFNEATIVACADHGDCWGENGLWEHGISHHHTTTVPLLLKFRGKQINRKVKEKNASKAFKKVKQIIRQY